MKAAEMNAAETTAADMNTTGTNTIDVLALHAAHGAQPVLRGIELQLRAGEVSVIVGPNGCGKSTLLRCIARLHRPDRGQVRLDGADVHARSPREAARHVALLPQSPTAPDGITVGALVRFGRHPHQRLWQQWSLADEQAVRAAMQATGVLPLADRLVEQLSGGQRQRCWLAMALAQETPWLLLDEPTSMLDLGHQGEVLSRVRALAEGGRGVVMVLHDLVAAARHADQLIAMKDGQVVAAGPPASVVTPALVRQLYGVEVHVLARPGDGAPVVVPAD